MLMLLSLGCLDRWAFVFTSFRNDYVINSYCQYSYGCWFFLHENGSSMVWMVKNNLFLVLFKTRFMP